MQRVRPDRLGEFRREQEEITRVMREFPGFIGKELIPPVEGLQDEWVAVFRFESNEALRRWMESPERRAAMEHVRAMLEDEPQLQVLAGGEAENPPVAAVFSHRVRSGREEAFRAWRRRTLAAMEEAPGYLGIEIFDPQPGVQDEWVEIVRFDTAERFQAWMTSARRKALLRDLEPLIESLRVKPLATGLEGWFSFGDARPFARTDPPAWKQVLVITLGLYPTVMLLALFLDPHLRWLPFPAQMVIGNLVCVALLTLLVMPWLTRGLKFWLAPGAQARHAGLRNAAGVAVVLLGLALLVALFVSIWPS